ncbi:alpha/beta hydrolase [Chitinophaga silvatica]|uniref:Alpha/beta hydrolase n=1 Tax=Chitinophaga silvatica TaxID=2282649 RepID=A0A3E1YAR1_9BACT|nr:alpha/beta hydrolase [Chitinophaga silvatica]RFS22726.1 alpha/beta hydrolase [Chitinophaga silvatica]
MKALKLGVLIAMLGTAVSVNAQQEIPLYSDSIPNSIGKLAPEDIPTLTIFKPAAGKANGTAIVIFPGGAYGFLAFKEEGLDVAKAFAEKGVMGIVVKYRLPSDAKMRDKSIGPIQDAEQAMKVVRTHATEWGIDKDRIGVAGYSAGGHLVATLGTRNFKNFIPNNEKVNLRPDFMILMYPVISMQKGLAQEDSKLNLLGPNPSKEKVDFFSNEEWINNNTPPAYIAHANDDAIVTVNNSILFYQNLVKVGILTELHLYPTGNHGFVLQEPTEEWITPMLDWMKRGGWYPKSNDNTVGKAD